MVMAVDESHVGRDVSSAGFLVCFVINRSARLPRRRLKTKENNWNNLPPTRLSTFFFFLPIN